MTIPIVDLPKADIISCFPECFEFIKQVKLKNDVVLVHCNIPSKHPILSRTSPLSLEVPRTLPLAQGTPISCGWRTSQGSSFWSGGSIPGPTNMAPFWDYNSHQSLGERHKCVHEQREETQLPLALHSCCNAPGHNFCKAFQELPLTNIDVPLPLLWKDREQVFLQQFLMSKPKST